MTMAEQNKPVWRDEQYNDHVRTYESFMKFSLYGTISVIVVLVLMAIFLL